MNEYEDKINLLKKLKEGLDETEANNIDEIMDIIHDYLLQAEELSGMIAKYEIARPAKYIGSDMYTCPDCGKRIKENHSRCHWCGCLIEWKPKRRAV